MKDKMFVVVVMVAMFVLAACGGGAATATSTASTANEGQAANTLAATSAPVATAVPAASPTQAATLAIMMDPAFATDTTSRTAVSHVYEGLVGSNSSGQAIGLLASNISESEDGLDYIFTIRTGVTFHDGTKLDADAVITNFNRWFDPKDPLHGSGTYSEWVAAFGGFKGEIDAATKGPKSEVDGIQKQDTMTVIVHLNRPDPIFLSKLADPAFSIVSPAALKVAGFGTASGVDGGSGPYKLGTWNATSLSLDPYSGYWRSALVPTSSLTVTLGQ